MIRLSMGPRLTSDLGEAKNPEHASTHKPQAEVIDDRFRAVFKRHVAHHQSD